MAPGPALAMMLASIDRSRLAAEDRQEVVRARARQVAFEQAELLAELLDAGRSALAGPGSLQLPESWDEKFAPDVVSWMLHCSVSYAAGQLTLATALINRLPRVYAALRAGQLDLAKAAAFVDALAAITDDQLARAVAARLLDRASKWTLAQLRERLRYHVDRADSRAARRRYHKGVADRGVWLRPVEDGTANLSACGLPPHRAVAAFDRLDRLARAARHGGDARTLAQLRADACLDLLTGTPFAITPSIDASTAEADAAFPPDPDDRDADADGREPPPPPPWIHAQPSEEQPDWWRRATRRRSLTPDQCEAFARTRAERDPGERDYPDAAPVDPPPSWWQHASTSRPDRPATAPEPDPADSRFGNGKTEPVLPGDRCTCRRLLPATTAGRGTVEIQLKLSTLAGLDDDPGLIPGFGPVLADIARQVAHDRSDPTWSYAIFGTDGHLAHHGHTRRRPTSAHDAFVRARDRSCRTPTCTRPATTCEIDHRQPWAQGGASLPFNLDVRCTPHHDLKEQPGVTITRDRTTSTLTLPCGNHYPVDPDKDLILINEE
jgi:hypothetical protein